MADLRKPWRAVSKRNRAPPKPRARRPDPVRVVWRVLEVGKGGVVMPRAALSVAKGECVCGDCHEPVAYLHFGDLVLVLEGMLATVGEAIVVSRHACPVVAGDELLDGQAGDEVDGGTAAELPRGALLPGSVLELVLKALEGAFPRPLTLLELREVVFDGRVSVRVLKAGLDELVSQGQAEASPAIVGKEPSWVRVAPEGGEPWAV